MTKQNQLPEGIYLNLPEKDYHSLPYFSRSFAEKVRFSGEEAQFYLQQKKEETLQMALGTAIHSALLEPDIFKKTYVKIPSVEDYKNKEIIQKIEDLKPYLELYGLKKSGKKEDLIASVRDYLDPDETVIWDDIITEFNKKSLGKKQLNSEDFNTISEIREKINQNEEIKSKLENGRPEITIIWQDSGTGIMCKCRLDYVSINSIVDIKTYSIKDYTTPLAEQLRKKTIWSLYNIQAYIYYEALRISIEKIKQGKSIIEGERDKNFIEKFLENSQKQFFIVYVRTQAPYQIMCIELKPSEFDGAGLNSYFSVAKNIWERSIKKYANFLKTGDWGEKNIDILKDENVPNVIWQQSCEDFNS